MLGKNMRQLHTVIEDVRYINNVDRPIIVIVEYLGFIPVGIALCALLFFLDFSTVWDAEGGVPYKG
jgi:hypothetical protein